MMTEEEDLLDTPEGKIRQSLLLSCFSLPVERQDNLAYLLAVHLLGGRHLPNECTLIDATVQSTLQRTVELFKRFSGPSYRIMINTSFRWMIPHIEIGARVFIGVGDTDGCPFLICVDTLSQDELDITRVRHTIRTAAGEASTQILQ